MVPTSHWFAIAMIAWFIVAGFDDWYIEKAIGITENNRRKRRYEK